MYTWFVLGFHLWPLLGVGGDGGGGTGGGMFVPKNMDSNCVALYWVVKSIYSINTGNQPSWIVMQYLPYFCVQHFSKIVHG